MAAFKYDAALCNSRIRTYRQGLSRWHSVSQDGLGNGRDQCNLVRSMLRLLGTAETESGSHEDAARKMPTRRRPRVCGQRLQTGRRSNWEWWMVD